MICIGMEQNLNRRLFVVMRGQVNTLRALLFDLMPAICISLDFCICVLCFV